MIHIVITLATAPSRHFIQPAKSSYRKTKTRSQAHELQMVLHKFATVNNTKAEEIAGHTLRTFLEPFLAKVAQDFNASFKIIE